ncbi:RelA/SpoT domain-containing protein [Acetobacter vaccinii]|uniref:RelA/SpoT domain-containing protein n=1 Tax=Acetobacter vaccinii TaxID=2592655 RepID=A0A5C1YUA5_9PROT|nr:RelA/SpoT domain-containing protein [Acetobacter vaccinii]QEO18900.1 RelA/SpoT domain-containing protein [Acetobacter vaccinii]
MTISKSRIDKAGRNLAYPAELTIESMALEEDFDDYRISHLEPLSSITLEIQGWLHDYGGGYYIAQRVKRKPQIIRKLRRLSVRLTQLQDIGGCRIIVEKNESVDRLIDFIKKNVKNNASFELKRVTDYRVQGRDLTGYRSAHLLLQRDGRSIELQIRSRIQHYWSESIERTSVIYGKHLKEQEGNPVVINYFKHLSDIFYEIESGRDPSVQDKVKLDQMREQAQTIIYDADRNRIFDSNINEDIVRTLAATQGYEGNLTNWIMVFNWNSGEFVTWDVVGRNAESAKEKYTHYENQFSSDLGFEVVMIGASDIATIRQTHSHYFGIEKFDDILENLDQSIIGFKTRMDIDVGARKILELLVRKKYWGRKSISEGTLKNHFTRSVNTFDTSINTLRDLGLLTVGEQYATISLNLKKKSEIERYL